MTTFLNNNNEFLGKHDIRGEIWPKKAEKRKLKEKKNIDYSKGLRKWQGKKERKFHFQLGTKIKEGNSQHINWL